MCFEDHGKQLSNGHEVIVIVIVIVIVSNSEVEFELEIRDRTGCIEDVK